MAFLYMILGKIILLNYCLTQDYYGLQHTLLYGLDLWAVKLTEIAYAM